MLDWLPASRLRQLLTVLGLSGLLALGACGGGSGAPNNPYVPPTTTPILVVQPASLTAYSGVPVTVTITSGVAPFTAFSNNASVLPVSQNVSGNAIVLLPNKVTANTSVVVTVQDAAGQTAQVAVNVVASSILNSLTFAASGTDCGADLCSGQTGTATVVATGPGGAPLVGRQIRFDVVYGPFGIATGNPGTPLTQTLTLVTDSTGTAVAGIQATVNAPTQPAQLRATDVTSGQAQIANFTVVNSTTATESPITVIPPTATITGGSSTGCVAGFRVDYRIFGGNPPYTVSSSFPTSVIIAGTPVATSGGTLRCDYDDRLREPGDIDDRGFRGQENNCVTSSTSPARGHHRRRLRWYWCPRTFLRIVVAARLIRSSLRVEQPSYNVAEVTNPPLVGVTVSPSVVSSAGGSFTVTYPAVVPAGTLTNIVILDAGSPRGTLSSTITCS